MKLLIIGLLSFKIAMAIDINLHLESSGHSGGVIHREIDMKIGDYVYRDHKYILKTSSRKLEIYNENILKKYFEINDEIDNTLIFERFSLNQNLTRKMVIDQLTNELIEPYVKTDF